MTKAELRELSLRARHQRTEHARPGMNALYFNRFRISQTPTLIVSINRVGKSFFADWAPTPGCPMPEIECTNDEWARELLIQLRVAQVLDNLASI